MGKHLTESDRAVIECMLKQKKTIVQIAAYLHRHYNTVYREIQRGTVIFRNSDYSERKEYCCDVGQRIRNDKAHNKGRHLKIGNDIATANYIEDMIINKRYSPYAVSVTLSGNNHMKLCKTTIYNYIYHDVFCNLTADKLIYTKHNRREKEKQNRRPSYKMLGAKTIEERPKEVNERNTYGHWEMDTVYSGKNKSKACLLVLTERYIRCEIIRKINDRTAQSVLNEINKLEKEFGQRRFKRMFKTITVDNGVEFSKYENIEKSCLYVGNRTQVYFCHAFCSFERGSNEKANAIIRKYIPKAADIGSYSKKAIQAIEDAINNYPRNLFGGLSSNEYMARLGIVL